MGIINKLFSSGKSKKPADLSVLSADMHSHFIPNIDDGSQSFKDSVRYIKRLQEVGYKKIITTPHIMHDYYKNTPEIIAAGLENLIRAVENEGIDIQLEAAAEYLLDGGFEDLINEGKLLTFGEQYLLIELSYFNAPANLKEIIFNLQISGYKVILAHPERYTYWFNNFKIYEELKDRNVFFQLNTISLSGYYSPIVKKMAEKLVDLKMIDFLGTDMHNENYLDGLEKTLYEKYLFKVIETNKLLNNTL
ncbi:tyrosine-protein phosphatase [Bacteroidota bacterium]